MEDNWKIVERLGIEDMSGEDGEDESPRLREPANLMLGEANMPETVFSPGKPLLLPRTHQTMTAGEGTLTGGDPAMLSPPSLRAYADRMQADYLRYRLAHTATSLHH